MVRSERPTEVSPLSCTAFRYIVDVMQALVAEIQSRAIEPLGQHDFLLFIPAAHEQLLQDFHERI